MQSNPLLLVSNFKIVVVFFFLFGLKGFSQTDKVYFIPDSLKGKSYKYLYEKNNFYSRKGDSIKELFYAKMYLHKGKNEKDTIRVANGYSQILAKSSPNVAISYSDSILALTKSMNHYLYPSYAYMTKGIYNYSLGYYEKSLKNYLLARDYAVKNNNKQHLFYVNKGIANIKRIFGNYEESIEVSKLNLEESKKHFQSHIVMLYGISYCYLQLKEIDSFLLYNKKGKQESLKRKDEYWYYSFIKQKGYYAYQRDDLKEALDSINKGAVYDKIPADYLNTYYYKGMIFNKLNKKGKAFSYFKKADSVYNKNPKDILPDVRNVQEYFVKYYGENQDFDNQLKYINRLLLVDSILDSYRKNLNETIKKEYDRPRLLAEKQTIIDSLEKDNKQSNYAIWGLIGLSILILTLTIRFYYLQRQYRTRFNTLIQDTTKENTLEKVERKIEIKEELEGISAHIITSVLNQLKTFEDETQFLDKTITLANLSKRFNTNSSYLSKIVNHYNDKNFNSYLTELRINHCIEQLQTNKGLRNYTIKAIAEDIGFKNSESFSKAFFKTTGIYPSYFIKQIEKQEKVA